MLQNINGINQLDINKCWTSIYTSFNQSDMVYKFFDSNYTYYDNWDGGTYYLQIDYEQEYRSEYGISAPQFEKMDGDITAEELQDYIEIMYARWIKTDMHYEYTIMINKKFAQFHLPFILRNGKIIKKGYKTSETIDKVLNLRMFERKIYFSEQMIMSSDILDKKCALDYIVDALQYYISIQNESSIDKKYAEAAKTVNEDINTKVYSVIKKEIDEVMKLSNEFFDIRHNEYLNKAKEKREALEDLQFIEYLYNRVYALLYLLRLKVKPKKLITGKS